MKKLALMSALLIVCTLWGSIHGGTTGVTETDFGAFLKDYEAQVIPLSTASSLAYFDAVISGKDADYEKSAQIDVVLDKIHSDPAAFASLKAFRDANQITDPLLKRELEILYVTYLGCQIDTVILRELIERSSAIEQKFNVYRVTVDGKTLSDNDVDSILKNSTNSTELEEVWKASKLIGREVAAEVIEVVKLRNRAARLLGFSNYYEMQLKLGEQEPAEIASLFEHLDTLSRGPFAVLKDRIDSSLAVRYNVPKGQLKPWHYQDRFFQEAPKIYDVDLDGFYKGRDPVALTRDYFAGIGIPADSIIKRSDLYERPGKYQHAQSIDIDRAGDVRVVCNVRPDYEWTSTMLHELGHGVYDYYTDYKLPWLLRGPAHSFTTEAIAEFVGRLASNPAWLKRVVGAPDSAVNKVAADCDRMQQVTQVVFSRWSQVVLHFERELYANPDQDLNKLWWDLVEQYQGLKRPEGRNEPDWAAKIHIATTPVYYHNYLLGELLASQLAETIGRQVLKSSDPFGQSFAGDPRIGRFLVDNVFVPGARYRWDEMIERATGEKLNPKYYVQQFMTVK
jgi:peptidyl-dipeptidase A